MIIEKKESRPDFESGRDLALKDTIPADYACPVGPLKDIGTKLFCPS